MSPSGACASTRNTSFIGAEVNHLCPCRVYSPSTDGRRRASVTLARTSEPPCFSVIPMPASAPAFSRDRAQPGVVGRRRRAAASTPWRSRRRPAAPAPRRTSSRSGSRGPARSATRRRSRRRGARGRAASSDVPGRRLQAVADRRAPSASATTGGSAPRRCGCRSGRSGTSSGSCRLASIPCSRASAEPATRAELGAGPRPTSAERVPGDRLDEGGVARSRCCGRRAAGPGSWLPGCRAVMSLP